MAGDGDKKRRRRDKQKEAFTLPSKIVCTAYDVGNDKKNLELGVVLSLLVIGMYLFSCFASIRALPDVATGREGGHNLIVAKLLSNTHALGAQSPDVPLSAPRDLSKDASGNGAIAVPSATWPVSLKDEVDNTEILIHTGDKKTEMVVPKFWSPPLHNNKVFTREQAMQVGTCITPDPVTGSHVRGDDCPMDDRTIFIAIASYRDFQCRYTVESAFKRAKNPHRIRIGIVDQIVEGEDAVCDEPIEPCDKNPDQALCLYQSQVDVYRMEAQLSIGPVFARHIGYRQYRGEYYATQSDAHVSFTRNWDHDIIEQIESTHNDMAVLTTYLTDVQGSIDANGDSTRNTRPIMCNTDYEGGPQGMHLRHLSQPERIPSIHGSPQLQPWWAAGYSFSRGHFVVNVPYDPYQPMIFQGEEMSIGIRGFTIGYDFYAPERSVCFHHYAVGKNAQVRNKVKHFWENGDRYPGTGKKAMQRLLGIVHMNPEVDPSQWDHSEEDRYGIGGVRTPEQFYKMFGINVKKKTTQGHLCQFVGDQGKMHKMFQRNLRSDGMGIDYTGVDFHWVDPSPEKKVEEDDSESTDEEE